MADKDESSRRLSTPRRVSSRQADGPRRSRSHVRRSGSAHRCRSRSRLRESSSTSERRRLHERERELAREKQRLRELEDDVRRRRSQLRSLEHNERKRESRSRSRHAPRRSTGYNSEGEEEQRRPVEPGVEASVQHPVRPDSPSFTSHDIVHLLKALKDSHSLLPPSVTPNVTNNINHKNILPDFDPSSKNQRVDIWLRKVNECATVYGWDERTTIHFAMQKLQGLAKNWYESLNSILFTWVEWQEKLINAFPCEQNYGQSLEEMLKRRSRYSEPIEVYFYDKLALLNQCEIEGKRAVDCIIHGLSDKSLKSSALALRCTHPDQLLQFLISNKETTQFLDRSNFKNKSGFNSNNNNFNKKLGGKSDNPTTDNVFCFNCKEVGHPFLRCPKPLVRCSQCYRVGHKAETCRARTDSSINKDNVVKKTMCISVSNPNNKFFKNFTVNGTSVKAFVDFGSEVSLLTKSIVSSLGLVYNNAISILKGFGNDTVPTVGQVKVELSVDGVGATVMCHVVDDVYLDVPLLVGQSFTEQSHVIVYKNVDKLQFLSINSEMPFSQHEIDDNSSVKIQTLSVVQIYGPASIKATVDSDFCGNVLVDSTVIGKPNQQYIVCGGIYKVEGGIVNISVTPIMSLCVIPAGIVITRALRVQIVNRILSPTTPLSAEYKKLDENLIKIGKTITESEKFRLVNLLNKYSHCFASTLKELGCTNMAEMTIEVNSNRPIVYRPYRLSYKEREQVRDMVNDLLDAGIIRESVSEYASPIILVRKKDNKLRLCVDFRMLNSVTVKERYPMPNIEDEIARLSGQAYFVTLDLASGYYQVPISDQTRSFTSFVTPDGQYEFNRMPFGLANAPAVFQRMMNRILGSSRYSGATAYIDDVLIYGRSVDECLTRLEHVLQLLDNANLTLNLTKCEFLQDSIDYLGYEISAAGIRPGSKKIQCVLDFPRPTNHHTVRQFLGLVGYFRKFIKNFAILAHPLNKLLKKDVTWTWTNEQEQSFVTLKNKLTDRPILAIYDPAAETELHTDASKVGIGGILLQRSRSDEPFRAVGFYSRQTSPEERNFHSYELETLAVICSLRKYRVYLLRLSFKVVTDCNALRSTFSKRDLIPRIARWWLLMQEFQCTIEYRPGIKMSHVDALSRNPPSDNEFCNTTDQYPSVMRISNEDWLHTLQLGDSELRRIRDILTSDIDSDGLQYIKDNYVLKDNKLYRCVDGDKTKIRWVVPKGARWQLCRMNHDDIGHFGVEKTVDRIKRSYWFPKMARFIKKYVNSCIECAYTKKSSTTKEGLLHTINKVEVPFHTLHVDHLGPFVKSKTGNTHLLVIVDGFTKFIFIRPVRNTKSQMTIRVLEDIFYIFRSPERLISDRGTSFTSHAFKRFCLDKGIKHILNAVASPRSNGQVERYNRTILSSLAAQNLNCDERDWDVSIGKVQWGLNNTCQKTTGKTPAEVMFGTCMNVEANPRLNEIRQETRDNSDLTSIREIVKDKIDFEQEKQKDNYDRNRRPARIYSDGELVKITRTIFNNDGKSKKLLSQYIGPYRVIEALGNDRYRVAAVPGLTGGKGKRRTTVAADRMLPWVHVAALEVHESDDDDTDAGDHSDS